MLRLDIRGVNAYPLEKEVLTEGRVGLEIGFTFSSDWDGLTKIAVFEGAQTIDVALINDRCIVPHETLAKSGGALRIGVYGQNTAGDIVIPTVWAKFGTVQPAAQPSNKTTTPPTPSVVAQILSAAQNAVVIAQSVRDDADAGEFDGKDGATLWFTTVEPMEPMSGGYEFMVSDLTGASGLTPKAGDIIFYDSAYYPIARVTGHSIIDRKAIADLKVDIRGEEGETGPQGPVGPGGKFPVVYGETTVAQIDEAVAAGKVPVFVYQNRWYNLAKVTTSPRTVYTFTFLDTDGTLYWAQCYTASADTPTHWSFGSLDLAGNSI